MSSESSCKSKCCPKPLDDDLKSEPPAAETLETKPVEEKPSCKSKCCPKPVEETKPACKKKCCPMPVVTVTTGDSSAGCKSKCCPQPAGDSRRSSELALLVKTKQEAKPEIDLNRWRTIAWALAWFTIIYNVAEGLIAIYYGMEEESIMLLGFGGDSFIEVFSAAVVIFRLWRESHVMNKDGDMEGKQLQVLAMERICAITIAVLLLLLALSAVAGATIRLVNNQAPDSTIPGIIVAGASLSFMYFLYYYKLKAARILQSITLEKDAMCSLGCIHLSCTLLAGSLIQLFTEEVLNSNGAWWMDAVVTYMIAFLIGREGYGTIVFACSDDFDGTCSCCGPEGVVQIKKENKAEEVEAVDIQFPL